MSESNMSDIVIDAVTKLPMWKRWLGVVLSATLVAFAIGDGNAPLAAFGGASLGIDLCSLFVGRMLRRVH